MSCNSKFETCVRIQNFHVEHSILSCNLKFVTNSVRTPNFELQLIIVDSNWMSWVAIKILGLKSKFKKLCFSFKS